MQQGEGGQPRPQPGSPPVGAKAPPVIVGISGSSGAVLACRTIEVLAELGLPMHITYTAASRQVSAVSRMVPGGANCSIRAARLTVLPTAL